MHVKWCVYSVHVQTPVVSITNTNFTTHTKQERKALEAEVKRAEDADKESWFFLRDADKGFKWTIDIQGPVRRLLIMVALLLHLAVRHVWLMVQRSAACCCSGLLGLGFGLGWLCRSSMPSTLTQSARRRESSDLHLMQAACFLSCLSSSPPTQ